MKGGVGKTSVSANLAAALATHLGVGHVGVVDLDPQDALQWHLGVHDEPYPGICHQSLSGEEWGPVARPSKFGVDCLPYGDVTEAERVAFESLLSQQPDWVVSQLELSGFHPDGMVIIDTPPGPTVYLKQVCACADIVLAVVLADAGSYATIPAMETWLDEARQTRPDLKVHYLLNQVDRNDPLNRDTVAFLRKNLPSSLCPIEIHTDEAASEALALQQPVFVYEPHSQASSDIARLAVWIMGELDP